MVPIIPSDTEALSNKTEVVQRAKSDLDSCYKKRTLLDTFTVDHLLQKLSSERVFVNSCHSPRDGVDLPFFERYLKPSKFKGKEVVLLPMCDGIHFQGYIVEMEKKTITLVDSFKWSSGRNSVALRIGEILFGGVNVSFRCLFITQKQFDSNSCGAWLIAGMRSYLENISDIHDRDQAFDLCYGLFDFPNNSFDNSSNASTTSPASSTFENAPLNLNHSADEIQESPPSSYRPVSPVSSLANPIPFSNLDAPKDLPDSYISNVSGSKAENPIDSFTSADFLIKTLKDERNSDYFRPTAVKGVRTTYFYTTDCMSQTKSQIFADDNGAYRKTRNNKKLYYYCNNKAFTVRQEKGQYYYNQRDGKNFFRKPLDPADVIQLRRSYSKCKSYDLSRTFVEISHLNGPTSPYVALLYQAGNISEESKVLPHGNARKKDAGSYYRTSKDVLKNVNDKLNNGTKPKAVYDEVNRESGGVLYSTSQSDELRDMNQVYRQKAKVKKTNQTKPDNKVTDELTNAINLQRKDPKFVRSVSCVDDSYYIFLGDNVQLNDIVNFCCKDDGVLCIDTTFNLCENWVTDCCYTNKRIERRDTEKNPIFLGPVIIHFSKDEFIFRRFLSEMCTFQPEIKDLKIIGTDLEKAIFNGFSSQISDLRLLLCTLHLLKNDKKKLSDMSPVNGTKSIQKILNDIYGLRCGPLKELGLADSKDADDLNERLKLVKGSWEKLCPGFFEWFSKKRKLVFEGSVIESARKNSDVQGLFYNNGIENMHFQEKKEQSFEKGDIFEVVKTIKKLVERQQDEETKALYGGGGYKLSKEYKKFEIDPIKWHTFGPEKRKKHIEKFRSYQPGLEDTFVKPKTSGRKPNCTKRNRKVEVEFISDPLENAKDSPKGKRSTGTNEGKGAEKSIILENPMIDPEPTYELHLRSKLSRMITKCQGNCGQKIKTADKEDFFLVKSFGRSYYSVHGRAKSRLCPQYIHFHNQCLKQFASEKFQRNYEKFPFHLITVSSKTKSELSDGSIAHLMSYGVTFM